jgi:MFS family permease
MIKAILGDDGQGYNVNDSRSIVAFVYLSVVGVCVFILQPGFVAGMVEYLGFTEQQAGYIASAEMFGLAGTTVLTNFIMHWDWRKLTGAALVLMIVANVASLGQADPVMFGTVRVLAGMGSGVVIALSFAMMGLTDKTDRNFGYIITFVLLYGGVGLFAIPVVFNLVGMGGALVFFALFSASGLLFVRYLPRSGPEHVHVGSTDTSYGSGIKLITLTGWLVYNIAIGIVWAYLFLVGLNAGLAEQSTGNILGVSQFVGAGGAFLAVILEKRIGRTIPLMVGILGGAFGIYLLLGEIAFLYYALGVCIFNLLWNVVMPYMLATLADFDSRGRMVVMGVSAQMIGTASGPAIAAMLLGDGDYDRVNTTAIILFIVSAFVILPGIRAQLRHHNQGD